MTHLVGLFQIGGGVGLSPLSMGLLEYVFWSIVKSNGQCYFNICMEGRVVGSVLGPFLLGLGFFGRES